MSMFVVGKKYRSDLGVVFTCVWADSTMAAVFSEQYPHLSDFTVHENLGKTLREYVEPLKGYVNVWKREDGRLVWGSTFDSKEKALQSGGSHHTYVGTVEVVYNGQT